MLMVSQECAKTYIKMYEKQASPTCKLLGEPIARLVSSPWVNMGQGKYESVEFH